MRRLRPGGSCSGSFDIVKRTRFFLMRVLSPSGEGTGAWVCMFHAGAGSRAHGEECVPVSGIACCGLLERGE